MKPYINQVGLVVPDAQIIPGGPSRETHLKRTLLYCAYLSNVNRIGPLTA